MPEQSSQPPGMPMKRNDNLSGTDRRMPHLSRTISFRLSTLVLLSLALAACATQPGGGDDDAATIRVEHRVGEVSNPVRRAMRAGVDAVVAGDAQGANRAFNLAIARDLKNPALHAANALAYQLRMRQGERDLFDLAETGYLVALEQRHDFQDAARQLAHLYLENKRFRQAQRAAAYALELEPTDVEALHLLASASYSLGDVDLALWAVERGRDLAPLDRLGARMTPTIYAAAGLYEHAEAFIAAQGDGFGKLDSARLSKRVGQWKNAYAALASAAPGSTAPGPTEPGPTEPGDSQGAVAYAWSDCVQQINAAGGSAYGGQTPVQGDETTPLPSLPSPCKGRAMPRMAIVDVVILRTNESRTSSHGINFLENLAVTIQQSSNRVRNSSNSGPTGEATTWTRDIGLGTSAGGAVAYSLNIANVTGQTTEVIARPSLLVLDRQASQFFSGSNVSIGLPGAVGGSSSLNQINVGVSLSVTPTFVDDNRMLLNVKAARTFFEPITGSSTFAQSLQTSRNMVLAATKVNLDETLVLSGLTDHESIRGSSGVPVLKDVPALQYLFSKDTAQNFDKTVLVLITPRRAKSYGGALDQTEAAPTGDSAEPRRLRELRGQALKELDARWPALSRGMRVMDRSERAFGVRTNDIKIDDWNRPERIRTILQEAADSLT